MTNPFVVVQEKPLPCSSCKAECCNSAPAMRVEVERISEWLVQHPEVVEKLKAQERSWPMCPFVDMETYRCGIYPVRPHVCEMYGHYRGLACPKSPGSAVKTQAQALGRTYGVYFENKKAGSDDYVILGVNVTWDTIEIVYAND